LVAAVKDFSKMADSEDTKAEAAAEKAYAVASEAMTDNPIEFPAKPKRTRKPATVVAEAPAIVEAPTTVETPVTAQPPVAITPDAQAVPKPGRPRVTAKRRKVTVKPAAKPAVKRAAAKPASASAAKPASASAAKIAAIKPRKPAIHKIKTAPKDCQTKPVGCTQNALSRATQGNPHGHDRQRNRGRQRRSGKGQGSLH
jgi:hypothetical protein